MIALLLAASLAQVQPTARETPNLHRQEPAACKALRRHVLEGARPGPSGEPIYDGRAIRRLGDLPPAAREYAVLRKLGGCTLPAPVGYRQDYLLPGPADARP